MEQEDSPCGTNNLHEGPIHDVVAPGEIVVPHQTVTAAYGKSMECLKTRLYMGKTEHGMGANVA